MVAVYGNLMVMGIAVALFVATINLGKRKASQDEADAPPANPNPLI
jgi:prolipoprotein diacylglyceryltransferase